MVLRKGHPSVGQSVRYLASLPAPDWILVSVDREGRVLIPHGDTTLEAGDELTVLAAPTDFYAVRTLL